MEKLAQPTRYSGIYPQGWGGYTFLDYDPNSNAYHPGEDYNYGGGDADLGQPVLATLPGKVVYSGSDSVGYGNMIVIEHTLTPQMRAFIKAKYGIDTPVIASLYAHLQERWVTLGAPVSGGQQIGRLGKSGVQYAHLHFEIYNPNGELLTQPWRFYPVGWTQARIKRNWLPAFLFIEAWNNQVAPPLTDGQKLQKVRDIVFHPSAIVNATVTKVREAVS